MKPAPKQPPRGNATIVQKPSRRISWLPTIIFLLLAVLLVSDYKGWLLPVQDMLDQPDLTYNFGRYQLSLYIILQGVLAVIVIAWLTYWLAKLAERRIGRMKNIHPSSKSLIQKISVISIYILAGLMAINVLGLDLTSFSIIGGALGIGLGFGLQKIASNFISGLILLFERSVKIGDLIEMEDGTLGVVKKNSARYTLIETPNMREIMIPNEQFIIDKVVNWTLNNKQGRIDITIGVSYSSDMDLAKSIMVESAKFHAAALSDPEPQCQLVKFGPYLAEFILHVWISDVTLGRSAIQSEIMFDIWHKFKSAGIDISSPQPVQAFNDR